jgi:hypothetical protein
MFIVFIIAPVDVVVLHWVMTVAAFHSLHP